MMPLGANMYEKAVDDSKRPSQLRAASIRPLPPYTAERNTRTLCVTGLVLTYVLSIVTLSFGAFLLHEPRQSVNSTAVKEVAALVLNVCVTGCTECLGFIHSTSLRWALYDEGRLRFNSNLRLFTSAKNCAANKWYINGLWLLLIAFSYSSVSQMIMPTAGYDTIIPYVVCPEALVTLGTALLGQALLATWCIMPKKGRQILSWNSSPLNTALANLHQSGHGDLNPRHPAAPKSGQRSAQSVIRLLRLIIIALWALVPVIAAWGVVIWFLALKDVDRADDPFNAENDAGGVYPSSATSGRPGSSIWAYQTVINIFIITSMQLIYTIALHAAEQVVNVSRDEMQWRHAGDLSKGAKISLDSTRAAFTSWQTLTLWVLKPVSHWLFGICAVTFSFGYLVFHPLPIFCLTGMSLLLATFVTVVGCRRPKGPQPTAYGDLAMLATFVDDWGSGMNGRLFWGDKGAEERIGYQVVRLAGTAPNEADVGEIRMNGELYWGVDER